MKEFIAVLIASCCAVAAIAAETTSPTELTIDGVRRQALIILPVTRNDSAAPVIMVFHGHGGTMGGMERKGFQTLWPEAIIVCPQGLPTVGLKVDPEGKLPGWQQKPGDNNDRDLKLVDALLKLIHEKYHIDDHRIYATGHSNGGGFTYLLGVTRGQELAAIAPVAGGGGALLLGAGLKPIPVLHIAGERDEIVPFESQKRTMEAVRRVNGCDAVGQAWASVGDMVGTLYPSKGGTPFVSVIYPGTHKYPDNAPQLIIRFFKEHAKN